MGSLECGMDVICLAVCLSNVNRDEAEAAAIRGFKQSI